MVYMRLPDVMKKLVRGPQIISLKDAAMISAYTGISSGDLVVDAGAGSGFLAIYMGNLVRPDGKVVSYERRPDFARLAKRNVKKAGLDKNVEVKNQDIYEGVDEKGVDVITLDVAEPWNAVVHAKDALKDGGYLVSYSPTIEQVRHFVDECKRSGLRHEQSIECNVREMVLHERGSRPQIKGIMHTGYITFVRK
jgi:tRNA (adenine57-N1/adenine58-N1)-methyltransferase catalytic subunit